MSEPKLFTWWMHDNRPLSRWLETRVFQRVEHELAATQSVEEVDAFIAGIDSIVGRHCPEPLEPRSFGDHFTRDGGWRPGRQAGESIGETLWVFPIEVSGELDQLVCWPDKVDVGVVPVGPRSERESTAEERRQSTTPAPTPADESPVFAEMTSDTFLYTPAYIRKPGHVPAVYFTFAVTHEDISAYVNTRAFADAATARWNYFREMCRAINAQVQEYAANEIIGRATAHAESRRQGLADLASIRASLSFEPGWSPPAPHLAKADSPPSEVAAPISLIDPELSTTAQGELSVSGGERLSTATFDDVQRVLGAWASGIQRYPRSFSKLTEDDLSCLAASTLNATLPGADREVYRYRGKTDIVVRAEALPGGVSNEPVFVCEAKKLGSSGGPSLARAALEEQLLSRYLNVLDTSAVLLLYMTQVKFDGPRSRVLDAVRQVDGYDSSGAKNEKGAVEGWPILTFVRGERRIRVCVATVHLPSDSK